MLKLLTQVSCSCKRIFLFVLLLYFKVGLLHVSLTLELFSRVDVAQTDFKIFFFFFYLFCFILRRSRGPGADCGLCPGQVTGLTCRERQPLTLTSTLFFRAILESPINLTCMSLDCGRKLEHLEKTHAGTGRTCQSNRSVLGQSASINVIAPLLRTLNGIPTGCFSGELKEYLLPFLTRH